MMMSMSLTDLVVMGVMNEQNKVWVVVEYVMWEYCYIVGIFQTEQEAIDLQADGLTKRGDGKDYFLSRHEVPYGTVNARSLVRHR